MKKDKILEYMITPMTTILILLFIFLVKQIYPFGDYTICTVDMPIGYVPAYTQLWDILHGLGNIFYNFNLGAGSNIYGSIISNGFLCPVNWIVGLFSRENIAGSMSIILIIKMALMALTSYIFFDKVFSKLDKKWKVIGSLIYVFNGYTLLMYSNIIWYDSLALFPLITLAFKKILDDGKCFWYIILLAINLMISFYISWLLLMIIVFGGTVTLFTYVEKDRRKEIATKILVSTIVALLISFVAFLPAFMQSIHSYRLEDGIESTSSVGNFMWFKLFHIIFSGSLIYFNIKYFVKYKKDKKRGKLYAGLLFLTILPIFVDSINKMWHTGSYSNFPYRYGFITIFIMICVMFHYIQNVKREETKNDKTKEVFIITSIAFIFLIIITIGIYLIYGDVEKSFGVNQVEKNLFILIVLYTSVEIIITYTISFLNNKKWIKNIILFVVLSQIIVDGFIFIENNEISKLKSEDEVNNFNIYKINDDLDINRYNDLYKFKDETRLLMINYPYISKVPAVTTWLHIISTEQRLAMEKLGYSTYKTVIEDQGGTLASDVILGNKYTLSKENFDYDTYNKVGEANDIKLYDLNIKNNFTKIYDKDKDISSIMNSNDNSFDIQNKIIQNIFNIEDNIIEIEKINNINIIDEKTVEYDFNVENKTNLYLDVEKYTKKSYIKEIYINDTKKDLLTVLGQTLDKYPEEVYTNGILNLGIFEKCNVNIKLVLSEEVNDDTINSIKLAKLDVSKLKHIVEDNYFLEDIKVSGNSFSIKIDNIDKNRALFIPIIYDVGWSCKVNGVETSINRALDTFMSVDLKKGENNLEFVFVPSYFEIALKVTIITLICFILFEILNKLFNKNGEFKVKFLYNIGYLLYLLVFVLFLYKIYLLPFINSCIATVKSVKF